MKARRILSMFLAIMIVFMGLPMGEIVAWAEDVNADAKITSIEVMKSYSGPQKLDITFIEVKGKNLNNLGNNAVIVRDKTGNPVALDVIVESNKLLYYRIENILGVSTVNIDGESYGIGGEDMPSLTSLSPSTGIVTNDETMTINGSGFKKFIKEKSGNINFYNNTGSLDNSEREIKEDKIKKKFPESAPGGAYRLEFKYIVPGEDDRAPLTLIDNYVDLFTVHGKLGVSDKITISPNQGPAGTRIKIIGKELLQEKDMSVFFLKTLDGSDPYTKNNMGTGETYRQNVEKEKESDENPTLDVFTVKVPSALSQGRYYVVLTNNIEEGIDPTGKITNVKHLDERFTVIDNDDTISVEDVDPSRGPESGTDTTIQGRYIGSLSENVFTPNDNVEFKINDGKDIDPSSNILKITYEPRDGESSIGNYKLIGGEDGVEVTKITRKITVFIGPRATFREGSSFTSDVDKLEVRVPSLNIPAGESGEKEVVVNVETDVEYIGMDKAHKVIEEGTWRDGKFVFDPINYKPEIDKIVPKMIPVDGSNEIIEKLEIHIFGNKFFKHRYIDSSGEVKLKRPVIDLGGQVILDPNISEETVTNGIRRVPIDSRDVKVLDKSGNVIDGTPTNNLGSKISIRIPSGIKIDEGVLNQISRLKVINPIKNDRDITIENPNKHLGFSTDAEIRFVKVGEDKTPNITAVDPNIITTQGENGIKIRGSNFGEGVKVYLDGEEIKGIKRNGTGTEIEFNAPGRPEGIYQIIVQNEEGGLDSYDNFVYVRTYTNIKLNDFNPKKASANTLVTVKGENFVKPDPLVFNLDGMGVYKLIGTRVLLGGEDVNRYHMKGNQIALQAYESLESNKIVRIEKSQLKLSDYYHSVILEEGPVDSPEYYTLQFETNSGDIRLTDGDKIEYIIKKYGTEIKADKSGKLIDIEIKNDRIEIDGKTLIFKTPYYVDEDNEIAGNRVKVINNNELEFSVPPMPREGYYDLTVINPDTKRDSKTGNNGFYYSFQPEYNLVIKNIEPNEGSIDGEYYITINRDLSKDGSVERKFIDNGIDDRTSVFIGGVKVEPKDVEVSVNGNQIVVKVPKYSGDLANETDMDRKTVPVVVVNPDGGSGVKEDGFTYIIPISHPKIKTVIESEGSAAGDKTVYVEGSEFRFYEPYKDLNNNAEYDEDEPHTDLNEDGKWTDLRGKKVEDLSQEDLKILPKVYFGEELATIVSYSSGRIEVKTPKNAAGSVEVYLVNNDQGISNKVKYTYKSSNPSIKRISPDSGRRQGGVKMEIVGSGFTASSVRIYDGANLPAKKTNLQLVQFGDNNKKNISNKTVTGTNDNDTGNFSNETTKELAIGSLKLKYDNGKLSARIIEGTGEDRVEYKEVFDYDLEEIFLPINLLKDEDGKAYDGYELVRISLELLPGASNTKRLRVDRGFSPSAMWKNQGQIDVVTPSYYTSAIVPVTLINPDGGRASTNFEYKNPDSNPTITNILKDGEEGYPTGDGRKIVKLAYTGGNNIKIEGRDFRKSTDPNKKIKVTIGGIPVTSEIKYDPDEDISTGLYFEMPPMNPDLQGQDLRVVVENPDGGIATSEPIYIHITIPESKDLKIRGVSPNFGPTVGGTVVTIKGEDFRKPTEPGEEELKVYFGRGREEVRVPNEDILDIGPFEIVLKTPAYRAGLTDIKVVNPDGNTKILANAFTYVSDPKINSVVDPDNDKMLIQNISVEGGERIKILGSDFMEGARLVFAPVLRELGEDEEGTGDIITIGTRRYVLEGGVEGTEVERVNGQTILVTTPAGQLGDKGLMLINPDQGGTNIYNVLYGIPEIGAPFDVRAEVVFDQFIRVNWTGVKDALEYEIYMSEDGGKFEYIASTELTSYAVEKLRSNTRYEFLVRAIGQYGTSKPIDESKSNSVRTGRRIGPEDEDGDLAENTLINRNGPVADVIIGSRDFRSEGLTIDLTRGELAGVRDVNIRIPAKVIADSRGIISVIGQDYSMKFSPEVFKTSTIYDNRNNSGAGVVFSILTHNENIDLPGGQNIVGEKYLLRGNMYIDKSLTAMDYLNGTLDFRLDHDDLKLRMRKLNNMEMVRYDNNSKNWIRPDYINRLGLYTIIGSRR